MMGMAMASPCPHPSTAADVTLPPSASSPLPPNLDADSLRTFLISCTEDDVPLACGFIESLLLHQTPETALDFFRLCFSVLLQRIFGFQDSPSSSPTTLGWLAHASSSADSCSARALFSLLSPTGPLFASLLAIDRENALQFVFPNERLPLRVRRLLYAPKGTLLLSESSELFKHRIKVDASGALQVQLDIFEYYIFWFAYYVVCKENGFGQTPPSGRKPRSASKPSQIRSLGHWVSGLHYPFHHGAGASRHGLYLRLLHSYLVHFAQAGDFLSFSPKIQRTDAVSRGEIILLTLVEFWLMKDDPCPTPDSLGTGELGLLGMGFIPPGLELCEAVRLVINHANSLVRESVELQSGAVYSHALGTPRSPNFQHYSGSFTFATSYRAGGSTDFSCGLQLLQRPLYRFLCRAFQFWPVGSPVRQACHLVDLWLDYLQPWDSHAETKSGTRMETKPTEGVGNMSYFSDRWQAYVLANYPFYVSLMVHFLEFALKFVRADLESVLDVTAKIFGLLTASNDLLEFLKQIECNYFDSTSKMVDQWYSPTTELIREQNAAFNKYKARDVLASSDRNQLRLFGAGETVAFHAFQMLMLQAEAEIHFAPAETQRDLFKSLEFIKDAGLKVFDSQPACEALTYHNEINQTTARESTSRALGCHTCFDVKYRGDWMRRPIESTEVAWLARFLVNVSDALNKKLKLDVVECDDFREIGTKQACEVRPQVAVCPTETSEVNLTELLKVSRNSLSFSLLELAKALKAFLVNFWSIVCVQLRRRGWRVNLRFLAQKSVVFCLLLVILWMSIKLGKSLSTIRR